MPEEHRKEARKIIKKILAAGNKKKGGNDAKLEAFALRFLHDATTEYLESKDPEALFKCVSDSFTFLKEPRKAGDKRIRVFNPEWEAERTIVQIVVQDVPFLIDSTSAEISRSGLRIFEILHPVIGVNRDKNGKFVSIHDEHKDKDKSHSESIIQFEINYIDEQKICKQLERDLGLVLDAVMLAVADWRDMLTKVGELTKDLKKSKTTYDKSRVEETVDFLNWLSDNHFTLLGYGKYVPAGKDKMKADKGKKNRLGIFRFSPKDKGRSFAETSSNVKIAPNKKPFLVDFSKSEKPALVHRPVHMDYIRINDIDGKGKKIGEHRLLGLFTSSVYYQSATLIPIIRKKIDYVLKKAGYKTNSHNGKELLTILETYPRDELFQIDEEQLFEVCMEILELNKRPKVRMFVRQDRLNRFLSCIIFIPRERFNTQLRQKIQLILQEEFGGTADDYYTQVTDSPLARLFVIVKTDTSKVTESSIVQTERRLLEVTNSWSDGLNEVLLDKLGEKKGDALFQTYADAFPPPYTNRYHFGGTFRDILKIEDALNNDTLTLDLYRLFNDKDKIYQLKIFHPETQVTLSDVLPILENMGFHVIDELTFLIEPHKKKKTWVHHFHLKVDVDISSLNKKDEKTYIESIKHEFEEAFFKIWHKEIEDDILNTLIVKAGMQWRDVTLLRTYAKYTKQAEFHYSYDYVTGAISKHPILSRRLIELFDAQFSPEIKDSTRDKYIEEVKTLIDKSLTTVSNVAEDRIIRHKVDIIQATLRTNFFQKDKDGNNKPYISLKMDSSKVPGLPLPRPFREIFVYSYDIEGIHLRGGKVARGGLRWSDRVEDFRTEVLGLMKAQMVKNAVIVPVGSKGGFVVKNPIRSGSRDEVVAQGIECYKTFLRGMLDITDNIVKGKVSPPQGVVRRDEDDPYLVVAADKGTATFSDTANGLSEEYGFWLGDAFASGGSQGYDHKKMGITAKGAWVAVQRHFMEMGKDIQKEEFTVAGIGGMSGDVFGNGMLLSRCIKLVAAFGHTNIFIDPNPDPEASYKERERIFKMARSTWDDYNRDLISKGGGIFDKKAKSIPVSKEMKERFDISENSITPDELIKKILKADIDLLWNGGIGTYVKSENESHDDAGDRANDAVRINGKEVRFKVIGEGGNLGLTQLGRIEAAANGVRLNTDFIDNSAGVDCSDHEVNIKIAFSHAIENKHLNLEKRNQLLIRMTDEVADLVLRDNKLQTQAITISQLQGSSIIESQMRVMKALEGINLLDRKIEFLPDDETLMQRNAVGMGLTRPELSTLVCYSKIALYNELMNSNLPDDPYFSNDLSLYFPEPMRQKFAAEIQNHQLRREIIATAVANSIVNRVGSEYFFHIQDDTGVKGCDVARGYTIVRDSFNIRSLWAGIEETDGKVDAKTQVDMFIDIKNFIERMTLWFLRNIPQPLKVSEIVGEYAPGIEELSRHLHNIISPVMKHSVEKKCAEYIEKGVPKKLAQEIANLIALTPACDIVKVSKKSKLSLRVVGEIYFSIGTRLSFGWLRGWAEDQSAKSYWEKMSQQTLINNFYDQQRRLTAEVVKDACKDDVCSGAIDAWEESNKKELERYDRFIEDLRSYDKIDNSMLVVASKRAETICSV